MKATFDKQLTFPHRNNVY